MAPVRARKRSPGPKIHVKGIPASAKHNLDEGEEEERLLASDTDDEGQEDARPRAPRNSGQDGDDDEDMSDHEEEEEDGDGQKAIKTKEQWKEEKKARKAQKFEKKEERNKRTIFVGNLPSTCEPRMLRKHFIKCGAIESVRLRGIIPSNPKIPKKAAAITKSIHATCKSIFGYVVFWDPDSVVNALELNTTKIGDNFISVQRVGNKTFEHDVTVFIGNLPLTVQENEVREFFADCGRIQGVRLIRDAKTGIGKGFGFVSFAARDGVILALEKNDAEFDGREIRVKKAGKETQKRDKQSRKLDSKNARRRLQESGSGGRGKKSPGSTDGNDEQESGDEQGVDIGKKASKKKKSKSFSGEKSGKQRGIRKKAKHKMVKGRRDAVKKRAVAAGLAAS